jgi:hypothetical protein
MLATSRIPVYQTKPDLQVMIYLGAIILCATVMAGLSPAGESLRVDLHSAMKGGSGGIAAGATQRSFLIGAQVAMSLVLLVCAGLFIRARSTMLTADPGFEGRQVLFVPLLAPLDSTPAIFRIRSVAVLVLSSGARPIAWGIGVGDPLALVGTHAVATVLRHSPVAIQPKDPVTFLGVASVLGLVGCGAMLRPAWRAAAADPMRALRDE